MVVFLYTMGFYHFVFAGLLLFDGDSSYQLQNLMASCWIIAAIVFQKLEQIHETLKGN